MTALRVGLVDLGGLSQSHLGSMFGVIASVPRGTSWMLGCLLCTSCRQDWWHRCCERPMVESFRFEVVCMRCVVPAASKAQQGPPTQQVDPVFAIAMGAFSFSGRPQG